MRPWVIPAFLVWAIGSVIVLGWTNGSTFHAIKQIHIIKRAHADGVSAPIAVNPIGGNAAFSYPPIVSGGGGYTGPGDVAGAGSALGAYSVRAYKASYATGSNLSQSVVENYNTTVICNVLIASNGNLGNTISGSGATCTGQTGVSISSFCGGTPTCVTQTWVDQSGNGNNAAQTGSITFQPLPQVSGGVFAPTNANYWNLNNNNAQMDIPASLVDSFPFTIVAWVRTTLATQGAITGGDTNNPFEFRIDTSGDLELLVQNVSSMCTSNTAISANTWTQIGVTYDGTTCAFYINGAQKGSFTAGHTGLSAPTNGTIGAINTSSDVYKQDMAEVLIFGSALSSTVMSNLNSQPSP